MECNGQCKCTLFEGVCVESPPFSPLYTGHQDSVTCTGFSHDGKYVATGDMGGGVRVWSVGERQPACVFETTDIEVCAHIWST